MEQNSIVRGNDEIAFYCKGFPSSKREVIIALSARENKCPFDHNYAIRYGNKKELLAHLLHEHNQRDDKEFPGIRKSIAIVQLLAVWDSITKNYRRRCEIVYRLNREFDVPLRIAAKTLNISTRYAGRMCYDWMLMSGKVLSWADKI